MLFINKYKIKCKIIKANGSTQIVELLEPVRVYKKTYMNGTPYVTALYIPEGTCIHCPVWYRTLLIGDKCRAEYAIVISSYNKRYKSYTTISRNCIGRFTPYFKNDFVFPDRFDKSLDICASGIHFFFSKEEAEEYS